MNGKILQRREGAVTTGIRKAGTEIVGGFLLLNAKNLDKAAETATSCPVYEFDSYAEVREIEN